MRQYIAGLPVDIFVPERRKYRAILLMTHDLWVGGWCWHDWATRLCNLGWECWAVSLKGRDLARTEAEARRQTPDDCVDDLRRLIDAVRSRVIIIAHGFGAVLALRTCAHTSTIAGVFLAPSFNASNVSAQSRNLRLLRLKYLPLILLRQPITIHPTDFSSLWLNCVDEDPRHQILQGLVPESLHLVRASFQPANLAFPETDFPSLVLVGTEDRLVENESGRALATHLGGEFRAYPERGRWMLHEKGWEEVVNDIHRWLLHHLGESILQLDPTE